MIEKVVIEEGVTGIGEHAFACEQTIKCKGSKNYVWKGHVNLQTVTLPRSLTRIGSSAFFYCEKLHDVNIPMDCNLMNIGNSAFGHCTSLSKIAIPSSVINIGANAFHECSMLTDVIISEGVISIGYEAFRATALTEILIPKSVAVIGNRVFNECEILTEINVAEGGEYFCSVDGVLFDVEKTKMIRYPQAKTENTYTLPRSVICIEPYAFADCAKLTSVNLADDVNYIGECAFYGCNGLTGITIPASVQEMPTNVFLKCMNLKTVTLLAPRPPYVRQSYSILIIEYWGEHPKYAEILRVPAVSVETYKADPEWSVAFRNIVAIE